MSRRNCQRLSVPRCRPCRSFCPITERAGREVERVPGTDGDRRTCRRARGLKFGCSIITRMACDRANGRIHKHISLASNQTRPKLLFTPPVTMYLIIAQLYCKWRCYVPVAQSHRQLQTLLAVLDLVHNTIATMCASRLARSSRTSSGPNS